ncbi:MAG: glycine betaine ABC transporter substrate-binding protein [Desulfohalobiaceae bacterium]
MNFAAKLILFVLCVAALSCCSEKSSPEAEKKEQEDKVKLVYVPWSSELASAHVVQAVIEQELSYECTLQPLTLIAMWESIAAGDKDGMVAGWLPSLQARFLQEFQAQVQDLGPNLEGTTIGLVVPKYVDVDSIAGLKRYPEKFEGKIIGIDPHAGIMQKTKKAIAEYNLADFKPVSGSESTMLSVLEQAIEENEWVVVTGWTPHWKFAEFDLKYLQDPQGVFGLQERIHTIVRQGLEEDMPEVYSFLDRFYWQPEDMEQVIRMAHEEDTSYQEAAREWIAENRAKVQNWVAPRED